MKPRIYKSALAWNCTCGKWIGYGGTPDQAYRLWRHNRKIGRLHGISAVRHARQHAEMKVAARQQRVKDAQRSKTGATVIAPTPAPTLFEWLQGILYRAWR